MNSIETYTPPKIGALDGDDVKTLDDQPVDAAALETLRALMGGIVLPQQPGFQGTPGSFSETSDGPGNLLALLEKLLTEEGLPPSLAPLVGSLRDTLAGGGDVASNPEAAAQIKTLLAEMQTAPLAPQAEGLETRQKLVKALVEQLSPKDRTLPEVNPTPEAPPEVASLGHAILQSLDSQSASAAASVAGPAPVLTPERVEQVSSLMSQMADRVLVTDPLHGQTPEVRIKLADSIIPGTEVRVWREDGGQLRVEFDTVSPYWARVLNEASPLLSQRLNERLQMPEPAQVTVQQQGGQPEDGRSRNRQNPWDLARQSNEE